jgi:hypothetical protein
VDGAVFSPFEGTQHWLVRRLLRAFRKMSPKPGTKILRPITTLILLSIASSGNVDLSIHDDSGSSLCTTPNLWCGKRRCSLIFLLMDQRSMVSHTGGEMG